jgi:hypothetical protein
VRGRDPYARNEAAACECCLSFDEVFRYNPAFGGMRGWACATTDWVRGFVIIAGAVRVVPAPLL